MSFQLARRAERMNPSIIREILKLAERPGVISLAGGLPSPDGFPVEALREWVAAELTRNNQRSSTRCACRLPPPRRRRSMRASPSWRRS